MDNSDADFSAINEKHQQVLVWLEQVYGGEAVPQFELNRTTISMLYDLMKQNQIKDHNTQLVIDDHRQKTLEYTAEAQRLARLLKEINLTQACLSQSGVTSLGTLANLALHLETRDASDTSLLLALQAHHTEVRKTSEAHSSEQRALSQFKEKTKSALLKYNALQKALHQLEEQSVCQRAETEKKSKRVGFLHDKARQYKSLMQERQVELSKAGADSSVYHHTLVKKSEQLHALKQKIAPLRTKLQTYHDLPPDLSQTKVKVEELRQQVGALEAELSRRIDLMHL